MRHAVRYRQTEEEEESAFVSMTDMTVSFLFIVIILMAYFAFHYSSLSNQAETVLKTEYDHVVDERNTALEDLARLRQELSAAHDRIVQLEQAAAEKDRRIEALERQLAEARATIDTMRVTIASQKQRIEELEKEIESLRKQLRNPLERYMAQADATRLKILKEIEARLKIEFPDLEVKVSERNDALQFKGDGLFRSGQSELRRDKRPVMERVAEVLDEVLPCYTFGPASQWDEDCNPAFAVIEAIQVEGHTDSDGGDAYNLSLSNRRAESAFWAMLDRAPGLLGHLNARNQPVMSVAGYGKYRPVASNDSPQGKAENRRIDLRIIMFAPGNTHQIDEIRARLEGNRG